METIKLHGLDGVLDMLHRLPPEVVSKRGGPVRSALRKGALVILKAEKANLAAVTANTDADGAESTGLLMSSLIATRGKALPDGNGERYHVRVKRKTYLRRGRPVSTIQTARWLEYGTSQQPAEPFIRPAVAAKGREAIETIERELVNGLDRIVKKLGKK